MKVLYSLLLGHKSNTSLACYANGDILGTLLLHRRFMFGSRCGFPRSVSSLPVSGTPSDQPSSALPPHPNTLSPSHRAPVCGLIIDDITAALSGSHPHPGDDLKNRSGAASASSSLCWDSWGTGPAGPDGRAVANKPANRLAAAGADLRNSSPSADLLRTSREETSSNYSGS